MQINFDENCANSERIAKDLIEKVLDFVDRSKSKRKDTVRETLKNYDAALINVFDKMIERKAIILHSESVNGHRRTMISTAPRNLVFYSVKKMTNEVPSIDEMETAFKETWLNSTVQPPKNCEKFCGLKTEKDAFKTFMDMSFGDFYILASYCFCEYDRIKQRKEKEELLAKKSKELKQEKVKVQSQQKVEVKQIEKADKPKSAKDDAIQHIAKTLQKKSTDKAQTPKVEEQQPAVAAPVTEDVMETILDDMSKFNEDEAKGVSKNTAFDQYRNKREKLRKSVADKIDALHMLADINAYLKYSLVELKRMLDPALFRGNQYANLKYSNNEVFECGFDNTNILMTKICLDIESLERMKTIVDNALEVKSLFEKAKDNFEDGVTKEELEIVKSLAK
jgi:hypothetical protein